MLYLNPSGSNSYFRIYYHNDNTDTLSLDFELGDDAARINLFNPKLLSNITQVDGERYIQSMGGSRVKISLENLDNLRDLLSGKVLNRVILTVQALDQEGQYNSHEKLRLVKIEDGLTSLLPDAYEASSHIGGDMINGEYIFNITLYFNEILSSNNDSHHLYLFSSTPAEDANRTILNEDIKLTIHYSKL